MNRRASPAICALIIALLAVAAGTISWAFQERDRADQPEQPLEEVVADGAEADLARGEEVKQPVPLPKGMRMGATRAQ
jgi:hypothetical protein